MSHYHKRAAYCQEQIDKCQSRINNSTVPAIIMHYESLLRYYEDELALAMREGGLDVSEGH